MSDLQKFAFPLTLSSILHFCLIAAFAFSFSSTQSIKQKQPEQLPEIIQASVLDETRVQEQAQRLKEQEQNKKLQQQKLQQNWQAERKKQERRLKELEEQRKIEEIQAQQRAKKRKDEEIAEQKRQAEIKKQKLLEQKKLAELKKKKAAEEKKRKAEQEKQAKKKAEAAKKAAERKAAEKRKKEQQRLAAEKRKKAAEAKKRREQQAKQIAEANRKAAQAKIAAENARWAKQATVNAMDSIRQKVNQKWIRPVSLKGKFQCIIKLKLYPGGGVMDAKVVKSSGNAVFDRSAENAVRKAEPLPVPKDPAIFANFKTFNLIFKPE